MPFKTILSVLFSSQTADDLKTAIDICGSIEAHLSVLVVGRAPPPPVVAYGGEVSAGYWSEALDECREDAVRKGNEIEELLQKSKISADVAVEVLNAGEIDAVVARRARYADLMVTDPGYQEHEGLQKRVLNGALFESARPVLLMPTDSNSFPGAKRIMIAWDAGVEAATAVHHALGLLSAANDVRVVLVDPVPSPIGHGEEPGSDISAYLARHGISVDVDRIPGGGKDVAEVLLQHAVDQNADLIVMGGYGHSRLRERIFGGTTHDVIANTTVPVFMAH